MVILVFNILYFLLFLLGLGCYFVLDYGVWANNEVLNKLTSTRDKEIIKAIRGNCKKGRLILYAFYLFSLILFFILNIKNESIFLFFIFLIAIFSLVSPLRNFISNIAIEAILKRDKIKKLLLRKPNQKEK